MERRTGVPRGLNPAVGWVLQTLPRRPDRPVGLRICVERVTGIEPAWPAWKSSCLRYCARTSVAEMLPDVSCPARARDQLADVAAVSVRRSSCEAAHEASSLSASAVGVPVAAV